MNEISPLLRQRKLKELLEQVRNWRKEGKTKEEVFNLMNRNVLTEEDVENIYNEPLDYNDSKVEEPKVEAEVENKQEENNATDNSPEEPKQMEEEPKAEVENDVAENVEIYEENKDKEVTENTDVDREVNFNLEQDIDKDELEKEEPENIEEIVNEVENKDEFKELRDEELEDFPEQPFKLYDDEQKEEMINSIKINGIIQPLIVRPIENGKYQILSGHNRRICGREAGLEVFPCKIKYGLTDEEAKLYLVDTNLATRKQISPIERAKALLIRKNAYRDSIVKLKIERGILQDNLDSVDVRKKIQDVENMSSGNLQRYLRLNYLDESLQKLADNGSLSLKVAENLSYLKKDQQRVISNIIEKENIKISESQSKRLKEDDELNKDKIKEMLIKKEQSKKITINFTEDEAQKCFETLEPTEIKNKIFEAFNMQNDEN